MKTVTKRAFARAGLLGNPSDGYNGKTISIIVRNFWAQVELKESEQLTIFPPRNEALSFTSIDQLSDQVSLLGYYGGVRLLKAAIKRFCEYCRVRNQPLHERNFSITFSSNIPRQVGLAGSSAIVTATIRGLMAWYDVEILPHLLASLTLSAETELGIPAGLQDRVIQAYEGVVYMDFDKSKMRSEHGLAFGVYEQLDPLSLPNVYVAYATNAGQPTEVLHNNLKQRFNSEDSRVIDAMKQFAEFAERGVEAVHRGRNDELSTLINQNFDLRNQICRLHGEHVQMIETARNVGASAKYCGSGGAIVGTYSDDGMFEQLVSAMQDLECNVIKPQVIDS